LEASILTVREDDELAAGMGAWLFLDPASVGQNAVTIADYEVHRGLGVENPRPYEYEPLQATTASQRCPRAKVHVLNRSQSMPNTAVSQ
jgi:hypothetical protein